MENGGHGHDDLFRLIKDRMEESGQITHQEEPPEPDEWEKNLESMGLLTYIRFAIVYILKQPKDLRFDLFGEMFLYGDKFNQRLVEELKYNARLDMGFKKPK